MFSLALEYIDFVQSRKRLDRIGQTKKPLFYYLICKGTVEEKIYSNLQQGKDFDEMMFEGYLKGE
jgi:SNF2 family DNA or RNA helicase